MNYDKEIELCKRDISKFKRLKREELEGKRNIDPNYPQKYKDLINRAFKKTWKLELTLNEYNAFITQKCVYCNNDHNIGVDRTSSKGEYTKDNIQPCCSRCNMMKFTMSEDEFIAHITNIYQHTSDKLQANQLKIAV